MAAARDGGRTVGGKPQANPNVRRGTTCRARLFSRPPFRHSREIPAYAGMTGNPVICTNDGKGMAMGPQASRLRMETQASSCAKSQDAESMRRVDSASPLRCARNDGMKTVIARSEATKQSRNRIGTRLDYDRSHAPAWERNLRRRPACMLSVEARSAEQSHLFANATPIASLLFPPFGRVPFFCLPKRKSPKKRAPA